MSKKCKCEEKHIFGYFCNCSCHQPIDRIIIERDKKMKGGK